MSRGLKDENELAICRVKEKANTKQIQRPRGLKGFGMLEEQKRGQCD